MSFIPKVKMDFVPEEPEENEDEELIPEVMSTTEEINPDDIFEDTKSKKEIKKEEIKKEEIKEENIIDEEPPKEPVKKPRKKREYTEEQKKAMRERMAKVREARKIKGKTKKQEEEPKQEPKEEPKQEPIKQPIKQPEQPKFIQPQVNQQQAQEAIEKMIFAGIQSYEVLRKERKAKKKEAQKKEKEHEDFKNTLKRAMNRKNTNPYGNGFF